MVENMSPRFWNGGEIRGYDDCEEMVKWMNSLSNFDSIGIVNEMLLCPQNPRLYFHFPSTWFAIVDFQASHSLFSLYLFWILMDSIQMSLHGKNLRGQASKGLPMHTIRNQANRSSMLGHEP